MRPPPSGGPRTRAGEAAALAAAVEGLRLRLGRTFRPRHRVRSARGAADAATAAVRVLSGVR